MRATAQRSYGAAVCEVEGLPNGRICGLRAMRFVIRALSRNSTERPFYAAFLIC